MYSFFIHVSSTARILPDVCMQSNDIVCALCGVERYLYKRADRHAYKSIDRFCIATQVCVCLGIQKCRQVCMQQLSEVTYS